MPRSVVRSIAFIVVLALVSLVTTTSLAAQTAIVQGTVRDSAGGTISGASVTIDRTTLRAVTSASGRYVLRGVAAGPQLVRIRAIGYAPLEEMVTVGAGTLDKDFAMSRSAVELAPIDVVIGSRGRHTAAEELAVPVDVFTAEDIAQQGTTETSQILQALAPSVNFPRQSITDATDIVRPFTLRGLSPDQTLVLVNGWRQHQTAVLNTFAYGMGAGSSGVDLNTIPSSAIERIEVLRDGAAAQYGSDAIAGVVNMVLKDGKFAPFLTANASQYVTGRGYKNDGTTVDLNGGVGIGIGRGSLGLFGQFMQRDPTNRAWADADLCDPAGNCDDINPDNGQVIQKNNSLKQPNLHWGDGLEKDAITYANFRLPLGASGTSEFYAFGGYSHRNGTGNPFWRYFDSNRNWQEIYPQGFLPVFEPLVEDGNAAAGIRTKLGGWALDFGGTFGSSRFDYHLNNTNNASLGPCLVTACAPGPDGILGNTDDPGIPNQTDFYAGRLLRREAIGAVNLARQVNVGLPGPLSVAVGAAYRWEQYIIRSGETASWINGAHQSQDSVSTNPDSLILAPAGSSGFGGFTPQDASDHHRTNFGGYVDLETNLSPKLLVNAAGRYERYSDFGSQVSGKLALRFQPTQRVVLRGAVNNGFRAPGLAQNYFSHLTTNLIGGQLVEVGNYPTDNAVSQLLGAKALRPEKSLNLSGGLAFTPQDNLTFTIDLFQIKITDRILLGATFDDDTTLAILADAGFSGVGGVQYFTNGLDTKTQGIDLSAQYKMNAGETGTLTWDLGVNYTRNKITHIDPLPDVLANSTEPGLIDTVTYIGITEERPDWRGTLSGLYNRNRFHVLARGSYYGNFSSAQPGFCDLCRENYGAKTLFDLEAGYRFDNIKLSIGARNLFDVYPDRPKSQRIVDEDGNTSQQYNDNFGTLPWAAASPFGYNGRQLYTRAEIVLNW